MDEVFWRLLVLWHCLPTAAEFYVCLYLFFVYDCVSYVVRHSHTLVNTCVLCCLCDFCVVKVHIYVYFHVDLSWTYPSDHDRDDEMVLSTSLYSLFFCVRSYVRCCGLATSPVYAWENLRSIWSTRHYWSKKNRPKANKNTRISATDGRIRHQTRV